MVVAMRQSGRAKSGGFDGRVALMWFVIRDS